MKPSFGFQFHKPNKEKNPQDFKLMLYLLWRNEASDLLGGHPDYYSHYQSCEDILLRNERKYTADIDDLMEYLQRLNESGPPQHMWSTIAPRSEESRLQEVEGYEQPTNLEEEDIQASSTLSTQPTGSFVAQLHARYEAEANKQELPAEEYRAMMRLLNEKQFKFHRRWCKQAVIAMKHGQPVKPYRMFLSGPASSSPSHLILHIPYLLIAIPAIIVVSLLLLSSDECRVHMQLHLLISSHAI